MWIIFRIGKGNGWIVNKTRMVGFNGIVDIIKGDDSKMIVRDKLKDGKLAGPNGRFRKRLINMIKKKNTTYDDYTVSPVIRRGVTQLGEHGLRCPGDL